MAKGDLVAFTVHRAGAKLTLPVRITNSGRERAFYQADLRITGPGGFAALVHVATEVVGVYPGTSWPTELTVEAAGKPVPDHPVVTVEKYTRRPYPG
ncbi:hypothetical protein [Streptomyces sp. NPDC059994]|uniref:hypothetical protein n=1 Tax=Streptomyces sp. NPDC059994 TaxID=3347029 RepID=UPI00367AF1C6